MKTRTWELPAGRRRLSAVAVFASVLVGIGIVAVAASNGAPLPFLIVFGAMAAAITTYNLWVMWFRVAWAAELDGKRLTLRGPVTTWTGDVTELVGAGRSWVQGNQAYLVTPRGRIWIHVFLPDGIGLITAIKGQHPDLPTRGPA